jgi:hypothetical protein
MPYNLSALQASSKAKIKTGAQKAWNPLILHIIYLIDLNKKILV